jgi:urease accessory protein
LSASVPAALLVLADARFPAGGHAHSGGAEVAVADGLVSDLPSLRSFLHGRLRTTGLTQAALAAAACRAAVGPGPWPELPSLDAHADARHPATVQRRVSRAQGRAVLRAGRTAWPTRMLDELGRTAGGPHWAVAMGAVCCAAGLQPPQAALLVAHAAVTGPASATLRLLGLDPYGVNAVVASLGTECEDVAELAATEVADLTGLPAAGGPLLDLAAIRHEHWEVRLFAS